MSNVKSGAMRRNPSAKPSVNQEPDPRAALPDEASTMPAGASGVLRPPRILDELVAYQRDVAERLVLFLDALRQRAENMLAHERAGKPPLLDFDYELILDARRFERVANYALLYITRVGDDCVPDCLDPTKPPVVIIDPRAGHGPGIGGFKRESEVGIALHEGYAVYFIAFFPEPAPEQTLEDVLHALRRFIEEVSRRHPGQRPVLYGNCQAGWAATILAADCEGLTGPAVLNGSPLSYWAGEPGVNPMRVAGGLLGGTWLAHLTADLGGGRFDGAWLVQNFENLKPEAVWDKYATLYLNVDAERERFLSFERWWSGFYFLSREEILAIIENLFVGNRLEGGTLPICAGCSVDLRRIRNPLVIFASYGDNITPPHQALAWIPIVYADTDDLKRAKQRIVYLINSHVGHLGIFVSAAVAKFEHRAILENLPEVESLAPGLYEMTIDNPTGDPDCPKDKYVVRFEERAVSDIKFPYDRPAYERVKQVSKQLDAWYTATSSKWVQANTNPFTAAALEWLHPMRASRYVFGSSFNPWMYGIEAAARVIKHHRLPLPADHPFKQNEIAFSKAVHDAFVQWRKLRDDVYERWFDALYGSGLNRTTKE